MTGASQSNSCVVPGCPRSGRNKLGVRCRVWHKGASPIPRKGKTAALWASDAEAYLCDTHAMGGANPTLLLEPNTSRKITVKVVGALPVKSRTTAIKQK